jgi:5'-methylthioadenosine phosphorylase
VLTDQFLDRTHGRADTFYDRGSVQHLAAADPFDPVLHELACDGLTAAGETFLPSGTAVVIQGPRFSTRAESRAHAASGGHIINMTMCPEVPLAAELGMGTVNLAFVTDSDAGVDRGDDDTVSHQLVLDRLLAAQPRIIAAIETIIRAIPMDYAGVSLIPAEAITDVLARPISSDPM